MADRPPDHASDERAGTAAAAQHGADKLHSADGRLENPGVRFESTDISLRGVLITLAVFACLVPVQQFLTMKLFEFDSRPPKKSEEAGFATLTRSAALPDEPRLEQLDRLVGIKTPNVFDLEQNKQSVLHSYGPTTEKSFVHVPIDWAIKQAVEQIPAKVTKPVKPIRDRGLIDAGESNSGRVFRGED